MLFAGQQTSCFDAIVAILQEMLKFQLSIDNHIHHQQTLFGVTETLTNRKGKILWVTHGMKLSKQNRRLT